MAARGREKYDLICANLISNLLLAEKSRILNRLSEAGTVVLAGILKEEFRIVQRAYEAAGLKLVRNLVDGEWCSGAFHGSYNVTCTSGRLRTRAVTKKITNDF